MRKRNLIKLGVLSLFAFAAANALLSGGALSTRAFSSGPPAGHTGAPNEPTCTECHTGVANTGPGQFQLETPSTYEPGQTYEITIKHTTTDQSRQQWGFQLTALNSDNTKAGEFQPENNLTQVDNTAVNRQYIEHTFAGSFQGQRLGATWTVRWVAPSEDVGVVTFYAAGNQANANGTTTGDQIYTARASAITVTVSGPPVITDAHVKGKKLTVNGMNFGIGAQLRMDGAKVKKVSNDDSDPTGTLIAKKAGNSIEPGQSVMLVVVNPDGTQSDPFPFTRPL